MKWDELTDEQQDDLWKWYNVRILSEGNCQLLADLLAAGRFRAWDCPLCGTRVRQGNPEDWTPFCGACQPDYDKYPGNAEFYTAAALEAMCDKCRSRPVQIPKDGTSLPEPSDRRVSRYDRQTGRRFPQTVKLVGGI